MEQSLGIENLSDEVREKIANGKLLKHFSTICLLEQDYIKDNNKTIKQIVLETEYQTGLVLDFVGYIRVQR